MVIMGNIDDPEAGIVPFERVSVIGSGAWGTALAQCARVAGREVILWARRETVAESINTRHQNPEFLPEIPLDPLLRATTDLEEALQQADMVLLVVPSQFLRMVASKVATVLDRPTPLLLCAKGVESGSGALMTEVVAQELANHPLGVLSGPNFAAEVARGLPTATTVATEDSAGPRLVASLRTPSFRPYLTTDLIGAEVGGAVKNVLAIACGIARGRDLGENARAALITRGLVEVGRLAVALGGRLETVMGLAGLGDLVLTCSSEQSRNMAFGIALGQGRSQADILAERHGVVEGVVNSVSITSLAHRHGIEMPICEAVNRILNDNADIDRVIRQLLERPLKIETAGNEQRSPTLDQSNDALRDSFR